MQEDYWCTHFFFFFFSFFPFFPPGCHQGYIQEESVWMVYGEFDLFGTCLVVSGGCATKYKAMYIV